MNHVSHVLAGELSSVTHLFQDGQAALFSQAWIDLYMVCFDSTEQPEQLYVQIAARLQVHQTIVLDSFED